MKKFLFLAVFLLLLSGGGLFFLFYEAETHGDYYSETQRKAWNERLADKSYSLLIGYMAEQEDLEREKNIKERQAAWGPDWEVGVSEAVDVSRLPLEGLTVEELMVRAEENQDDDACFELAERLVAGIRDFWAWGEGRYSERSGNILGDQRQLSAQKWLQKVADRGKRPGIEYVLSVFSNKYPVLREKGDGRKGITGREDFEKALKEGDFRLYVLLKKIIWGYEDAELDALLGEYLSRKAEKRDQYVEWKIFLNVEDFRKDVHKEEIQSRHPAILWLADRLDGIIAIQRQNRTSDLRKYAEKYLDSLEAKARKGDLAAMLQWMTQFAIRSTPYSRKQWENIFSFSRQLVEMGHAEYGNDLFYNRYPSTPNEIILSFYSPESIKKVSAQMEESLLKRGNLETLVAAIAKNNWEKSDREKNLELLSKIYRIDPGLFTVWENWRLVMSSPDEEVRRYFLACLTEMAQGGNGYAKQALKEIGEQTGKTT